MVRRNMRMEGGTQANTESKPSLSAAPFTRDFMISSVYHLSK